MGIRPSCAVAVVGQVASDLWAGDWPDHGQLGTHPGADPSRRSGASDGIRRDDSVNGGRAPDRISAIHASEVMAVLEFYSVEEVRPTRFTKTMSTIGIELGECLARRRGQLGTSPLTRRELEVLQ